MSSASVMPQLNTTFNHLSNVTFNNILFNAGTMATMHAQMERLYQAAQALKGTVGQSAVARLLHESPQTVKNWESRGISKNGSVKAQATIGCNANWLLSGTGGMSNEMRDITAIAGAPANPIESLAHALRQFDTQARERAAVLLQGLARDPDGPWAAWLGELLNQAGLPDEQRVEVQANAPAFAYTKSNQTQAHRGRKQQ